MSILTENTVEEVFWKDGILNSLGIQNLKNLKLQ